MIEAAFAGVVVEDLDRAERWYTNVFGRKPDARPMNDLIEWHLGEQVVQIVALATVREIQRLPDWGSAGASSITLVVDDLATVRATVEGLGQGAVSHFEGPKFDTASYCDPDGNLVTFLARKG